MACITALAALTSGCDVSMPRGATTTSAGPPPIDPQIETFVRGLRAVDNHSHANSVAPNDADSDALPLDGIAPFDLPVRLRADHTSWLDGYKALYRFPYDDLGEAHLAEWRGRVQQVRADKGDQFPSWVLDQVGTEVLLANRIAMGPGLSPPRVRWVSFVDALMYPLNTTAEAAVTPDRTKLFPLESVLLQRYLGDLKVTTLPGTLDAYLTSVVSATLASQANNGGVAVKFEAAYLRALDFDEAPADAAARIYATYARGGVPTRAEYKTLQDYLFRYIAREAGRLGMAVHIHAFEGIGTYFRVDGADPLLLESALNDPALARTNFVIVHGGGINAAHAGALIAKPNVFVDTSLMSLAYPPERLAGVIKGWVSLYPERVLFGSDAFAVSGDLGWEVAAWVAGRNARTALASALTDLMRSGDVTRPRAEAIATMVMRTNAARLYKLDLK